MSTFNEIQKRMLSKVKNQDKRAGSLIYDAISPVAFELEPLYIEKEFINKNIHIQTADKENLFKFGERYNIAPIQATRAVLKIESNIEIPFNVKLEIDGIGYYATNILGQEDGKYFGEVTCIVEGTRGNIPEGKLIPEITIEGLKELNIMDILIPARNTEDLESYRKRMLQQFKTNPFGGNRADYKRVVKEISGVQAVKIERVIGGVINVYVLDNSFNTASKELIDYIQETMDPTDLSGEGEGLAPAGHRVKINTAEEVVIDVSVNLELDNGLVFESIKEDIEAILESYFLEIKKDWETSERSIVRTAYINNQVFDISGVKDVLSVKINGFEKNLELSEMQIPVLGVVSHDN